MQNDLLVQSRFRNAILWDLMGGKNAAEVSRECGVADGIFGALLNLKLSPRNKKSRKRVEFTLPAQKIADHFYMDPGELFPDALYSLPLPDGAERRYDSTQLLPLLAARNIHSSTMLPEETYTSSELKRSIAKQLQYLTPREESVIRGRFGIDRDEETLAEIAERMNITRTRVQQIEEKAIRRLRGWRSASRLAPYYGVDRDGEIPWQLAITGK